MYTSIYRHVYMQYSYTCINTSIHRHLYKYQTYHNAQYRQHEARVRHRVRLGGGTLANVVESVAAEGGAEETGGDGHGAKD